jgi:hypothetical protein
MNKKGFVYGIISYGGSLIFVTLIFFVLFPNGLEEETMKIKFFWTHFLVFLIWFVNIGAVLIGFNDSRRLFGLAGLLPGAGIVTTAYSLFSFAFMILASMIESESYINRFHLVIQLSGLFGYLFIMFIFCMAFEGARSGQDWDNNNGKKTLRNMENTLSLIERKLEDIFKTNDFRILFKSLKSKINTSLPNSGQQLSNVDYINFLNETDDLLTKQIEVLNSYSISKNIVGSDFDNYIKNIQDIDFRVDMAIIQFRS